MVRLSTFCAAVLLPALGLAGASLDLIPDNFDDLVLKSGRPSLVEFYAPWCGHCKTLAPTYEELAIKFGHASSKVNIGKVDADKHRDLGTKFGVQGFPTIKFFDGKSDKPQDYNGGRDLKSLSEFITSKTGVLSKEPPQNVVKLDDTTFQENIGKDKNVLVVFVSKTCIQCDQFLSTWEALNTTFVREPSLLIAKVNKDAPNSAATIKDQKIEDFPTVKFYPKGSSEALAYSGGLKEVDFIAYLNEKCGTFRLPGGGLNTLAGTIEELDALLRQGGNTVYETIAKAGASIKDEHGAYYVKVANKAGESKEYVAKELNRLKGMIAKGNVAPEKLDSLVYRSNILDKFQSLLGTNDDSENKSEL